MRNKSEKIMIILLILGIIISIYLTYLHYVPEKLNSSFCNPTDYLSCSTVNKSSYSTLFGIPVALIGIIGMLTILGLLLIRPKNYGLYIFVLITGALLFMIYLTSAELFIIKAICIFCITVALIVLTLFIISIKEYGNKFIKFIKEIQIE